MTTPAPYRIGVCSWSLKPADAAQLVERVQACGIDRIQLAFKPLSQNPDGWSDLKRRLQEAGMTLASGMFGCMGENYATLESIRKTGGVLPDETWPKNQRIVEESLRLGKDLGLERISTHAGFIPSDSADPAFAKLVERIRWVADTFAREGVALLLETGQETAEDLWRFLDAVDRPNVGVNFDPANMILYDKGDPVASLRRLMPRVKQVHIKDARRTATPGTWGEEVAVGEGDVDWLAFVEALNEGGFEGDLVIERERGERRVEDVTVARQQLERWISNLQVKQG